MRKFSIRPTLTTRGRTFTAFEDRGTLDRTIDVGIDDDGDVTRELAAVGLDAKAAALASH